MAGNSFGEIFRITTFGESHGKAIGVIIDGCPTGLEIDIPFLQNELNRRRPGQSSITTSRQEADILEIISGVFEGKTLGSPISILIPNEDQKSVDYESIKDVFRPSHADFTYQRKYGFRDYRGGGRSSARETAARVVAGAVAKLILNKIGIQIHTFVSQVGSIKLNIPLSNLDFANTETNMVRCPDTATANEMINYIEQIKEQGDSVGGVVSCVITGTPIGLGEPVFDKLHADLGKAMLSINAVKGFEVGEGFAAATMLGSEHNDLFTKNGISSNHSGGIQGGISNGEDIFFRVAFKPVATIMQVQKTMNEAGEEILLQPQGRHDPCVVPRAVPIVEAMAALVLVDHWLRNSVCNLANL